MFYKIDLKDLDRFERFDIRRLLILAGGDYFGDSMNEKKWQTYVKNGENTLSF